jgi:putative spermidine/putrescine transport system ATP-binding protein
MSGDISKRKNVELCGIVKRFGSFIAINGVDINIPAGEFCTLLGPSGSGKTTLLKIIAGYESPNEGMVKIAGLDVADVSVAKRNIGMVFQNYALFPHMTVAGNIAFPLEMRHRPRTEITERVAATLALVDLANLGERYPRELSGGQQQRVAVARALVFEPDILLMDEPLGALDKNLRQTMQFELKELHRRVGVTIIYVTHDQEEALYLSDRIVVFDQGRVAQEGTPEKLYNAPESKFVANFLGECNLVSASAVRKSAEPQAKLSNGALITLAVAPPEQPLTMIGIRPERISIGEYALACENQFEVNIGEVFFLGQGYKIVARAAGLSWTIITHNRLRLPDLNVGAIIKIGFDRQDLILITGPH